MVSEEQREALLIAFALDPQPSRSVGFFTLVSMQLSDSGVFRQAEDYLAAELGLERACLTQWFHSHRLKLKQVHGVEAGEGGGHSFDPAKFKLLLRYCQSS